MGGWELRRERQSVLKEGGPTALKGIDAFQEVKRDGDFVIEGHVRAEEVVEGDKEGGEGDGAVF